MEEKEEEEKRLSSGKFCFTFIACVLNERERLGCVYARERSELLPEREEST
jgi:hypothetical protein